MTPRTLKLRVPNRISSLSGALDHIDRFCRQATLPQQLVSEIRLAVEELLVNVIAHAWPGGGTHEAEVAVRMRRRTLVIEIIDDGVAFNPVAFAIPDNEASIENRQVGGLGLFLVRRIADGLAYSREAGRNRLVMHKALPRANEAT